MPAACLAPPLATGRASCLSEHLAFPKGGGVHLVPLIDRVVMLNDQTLVLGL